MNKKNMIISMALIMALISGVFVYHGLIKVVTKPQANQNCNHKWEKVEGEGHYEYVEENGLFCGCKAGPFSSAELAKHVEDIAKQYGSKEALHHTGYDWDGTKILLLEWVPTYRCSKCHVIKEPEIKSRKEWENKNKQTSLGSITVENHYYEIISRDKMAIRYAGLKDKKKKTTTLNIPKKIDMGKGEVYKVTEIAPDALKGNKNITKVTIGTNVQKIGKNAFSGCKKLKSITIKSKKLTAKTVGSNAFKGIHRKAKIKVPKSKLKSYKKLLKKKGIKGKKQTIKA